MDALTQKQFVTALLDPEQPVSNFVDAGGSNDVSVLLNMPDRFNVYRNNVVSGLIDALMVGFPVTTQLLGEEYFAALAAMFVRQQPPRSPVLHEYGEELPDFLRTFPPLQELRYVADVAQLEWCRRVAFHSADAPVMTLTQMRQQALAELLLGPLTVHPSVQCLRSEHPVLQLWLSQNQQADMPDAKNWPAQTVLIWRPETVVHMQIIDTAQVQLIEHLRYSLTLAEAMAATGIGMAKISGQFAALVQAGVFVATTT